MYTCSSTFRRSDSKLWKLPRFYFIAECGARQFSSSTPPITSMDCLVQFICTALKITIIYSSSKSHSEEFERHTCVKPSPVKTLLMPKSWTISGLGAVHLYSGGVDCDDTTRIHGHWRSAARLVGELAVLLRILLLIYHNDHGVLNLLFDISLFSPWRNSMFRIHVA